MLNCDTSFEGELFHILPPIHNNLPSLPSNSSSQEILSIENNPCDTCPLKIENNSLRCEKAYFQAMHRKALEREKKLKEEIEQLEAKVKLREQQLFGRKSEKGGKGKKNEKPKGSGGKRGQRAGGKGHGRRNYDHLPVEVEIMELSEDQCRCSTCGLPFNSTGDAEQSEMLEVEVKAHIRRIIRPKYTPGCSCKTHPGIITAPPAPKVIPRGKYGISVWVEILLSKFHFMFPTNRTLANLKIHDLNLPPGTVTGGLKKIAPIFNPIYEAIKDRNLEDSRWHADETRWMVFVTIEGKNSYRWYMWVFSSESSVVYTLDPSRSAEVPKGHFGQSAEGFLTVDRYSAYKAMVKDNKIILTFCWAHVRRDFLGVGNSYPSLEIWAIEWTTDIGNLYHLNEQRLSVIDAPDEFAEKDQELRKAVDQMAQKRDQELQDEKLHYACKKVLESLINHWNGLTVFVDHPEVPMDNNEAERYERVPVVGRKLFYGSVSEWSGYLLAVLMSIFQTLGLWNINPKLWLTMFLSACAENEGKAPKHIDRFLPWNMPEEELKGLALKPAINDSS